MIKDISITIKINWVYLNHAMAILNLLNLAFVTFLIFFYPNVTILQVTAILAWIFTITQVIASKMIKVIIALNYKRSLQKQLNDRLRDQYK